MAGGDVDYPISWESVFPSIKKEDATTNAKIAIGLKYDQEKSRVDLIDPDFMEEVGNVLGFGAKKYAAHNWRNGINVSRLIAACQRHLNAINRGEDIDPESGLKHTGHLGCCVMFLDWMIKNRKNFDDRWHDPMKKDQKSSLTGFIGGQIPQRA